MPEYGGIVGSLNAVVFSTWFDYSALSFSYRTWEGGVRRYVAGPPDEMEGFERDAGYPIIGGDGGSITYCETQYSTDCAGPPAEMGWSLAASAEGCPVTVGADLSVCRGQRLTYGHANGALVVTDAFGRQLSIKYNEVSDSNGRVLELTWQPKPPPSGSRYSPPYELVGVKLKKNSQTVWEQKYAYVDALPLNAQQYRPLLWRVFLPRDLNNPALEYAWTTDDRIDAVQRANGAVDNYFATGRRTEVHDALNGVSTAWFDLEGRIAAARDPEGRVARYRHDGAGRLTSAQSPWGDKTTYAYDTYDNLLQVQRAPRSEWAGDPTWGQEPTSFAVYGDADWPTLPTRLRQPSTVADSGNGDELWTLVTYDNWGHPTTIESPKLFNGSTGEMTRSTIHIEHSDSYGRPTKITDGTGRFIEFGYGEIVAGQQQGAWCATSERVGPNGLGILTQKQCDGVGNVIAVVDPRGHTMTSEFDAMRRPTKVTGPVSTGIVTEWQYDPEGNVVEERRKTDSGAFVTTLHSWSVTGMETSVTDPAGDKVRTCYDLLDRPVRIVDPEGRVTQTTYNLAGQPVLVEKWLKADISSATCELTTPWPTPPGSPSLNAGNKVSAHQYRRLTYNAGGLLASEADANGNVTTFTYEGLGRLIQTTFPDPDGPGAKTAPVEVTIRDERDKVVERLGRDGRETRYFFDRAGRPRFVYQQSSPGQWSQARVFTHDLAGRPIMRAVFDCTALNCPQGNYRDVRQFEIDAAGRTNIEWSYPDYTANSSLVRYIGHGFDAASNRTLLRWPDGFEAHFAFDAANRMIEAKAGVPDAGGVIASPVVRAGYAYDALSRRTGVVRGATGGAASTNYTYEIDSDLETVAHTTVGGSQPSFSFAYGTNPSGQIGSMQVSHGAFQWAPSLAAYVRTYGAPNALNQQSSEAGNAIDWEEVQGKNAGNMAEASLDGSSTRTSFAHDAANRMLAASKSGMSAIYVYDADDRRTMKTVTRSGVLTTQTLWSGTDEIGEYDAAGALQRRIIPGPGIDDKVAVIDPVDGAQYFHTDRLGSVVALTNASGAVTATYRYSAYGESDAAPTGDPWRFTGRYLDEETGLYYYRARYYSARLGQFLQTDPVGTKDDPNLYMYVRLDPGNGIDPTGRDTIAEVQMPDGSWERARITEDIKVSSGNSGVRNVVSLRDGSGGGGGGLVSKTKLASVTLLALQLKGDTPEPPRTYVTYTRELPNGGPVYSGRTSGYGSPEAMVILRAAGQPHLNSEGYMRPNVDRSTDSYLAIRGREQQLIDYYGGAQSVGGTARNKINGINDLSLDRPIYMKAARALFGEKPDNSPKRFRVGR